MLSKNVKSKIQNITIGALLLGSVSAYAIMAKYVDARGEEFDKKHIVVGDERVSLQKFYENISYDKQAWRLELKNGRVINFDSLSDFKSQDNVQYSYASNVTLETVVDTVNVRMERKPAVNGRKALVFGMNGVDSLGYFPSLGKYHHGILNIRYFLADTDYLQGIVDQYNDEYNCTAAHERQHYIHELYGVNRCGQNYEYKFMECCQDEIFANIRQLFEQRRKYLENGRDENRIGDRFESYRKALISGEVRPILGEPMSEKEKKLIFDGVFDGWMKNKFSEYTHRNASRTKNILRKTNYNGIQKNLDRHDALLKKMSLVDGVDFYLMMKQREEEILQRIPVTLRREFLLLKRQKYRDMTEIDKLEQFRMEEGVEKYNRMMRENQIIARLRALGR